MSPTPTRASRRRAALLAAVLVVVPASARGQEQGRATAEELFQLGKGAMARQDYPKACGYFQASIDAEFALGTLLNLAICHEQAGKIASAWAEFRTLEDRARRATPPQVDRAQYAHERVEALRPRLSRLRIQLTPEASAIAGLKVTVDGVTVVPELFDVGVPVDVGKRKVEAVAPQRQAWSTVVTVDDDRLRLDVSIPGLPDAPKAAASPPGPPREDPDAADRLSAARSQRLVGFVSGGIGVGALVTGTVFGLLAVGAANDARCPGPCITGGPAQSAAEDAYHRANTFGWVSNVAIAAGLVGIGVGAFLVLTAKTTPQRPVGAHVFEATF